jgi:isoleucyl-tRNA synthetase
LRNYPDPVEVFETIGADPLRWYLMSSPILRGGDVRIRKDAKDVSDVVRLVINPIWNTYSFFCRYANADRYQARVRTDSPHLLDRYILAKTRALVEAVTDRMDAYDIAGACGEIDAYLDALTNWYVRRSRDRFWGSDGPGDPDAYDTLYTVLVTLLRVAAPLLPMLTEEMYGGLCGGASVHLADWPDPAELPSDPDLVARMDLARAVCSAALSLREDSGLRVRLPLPELVVAGPEAETLAELTDVLADELNVKSVRLVPDASGFGERVLRPNAKVLGPKLGGEVQKVLAAARAGEWQQTEAGVVVAGHTLADGEYELVVQPAPGRATAAVGGTGLVVDLDTTVTPELEAEGRARDVIRIIQQARKDADLHVSDRIELVVGTDDELRSAIETHADQIRTATLAVSLAFGPIEATTTVDGHPLGVELRVAAP